MGEAHRKQALRRQEEEMFSAMYHSEFMQQPGKREKEAEAGEEEGGKVVEDKKIGIVSEVAPHGIEVVDAMKAATAAIAQKHIELEMLSVGGVGEGPPISKVALIDAN